MKDAEKALRQELQNKELQLEKLRLELCELNVEDVHPDHRENVQLYIKWKRALCRLSSLSIVTNVTVIFTINWILRGNNDNLVVVH